MSFALTRCFRILVLEANSHLLQLFVDLCVIFIVLDQLDHQRPVREREELRILHRRRDSRMAFVVLMGCVWHIVNSGE